MRTSACSPFNRRVALSRATGPAEAKDAARMARSAKVRGAMRDSEIE